MPCASNQCISARRTVPSRRRTGAIPFNFLQRPLPNLFRKTGKETNIAANSNRFNLSYLSDNFKVHRIALSQEQQPDSTASNVLNSVYLCASSVFSVPLW